MGRDENEDGLLYGRLGRVDGGDVGFHFMDYLHARLEGHLEVQQHGIDWPNWESLGLCLEGSVDDALSEYERLLAMDGEHAGVCQIHVGKVQSQRLHIYPLVLGDNNFSTDLIYGVQTILGLVFVAKSIKKLAMF